MSTADYMHCRGRGRGGRIISKPHSSLQGSVVFVNVISFLFCRVVKMLSEHMIYLPNATVNALEYFSCWRNADLLMRMLSLVTSSVLDLAKALFKEFPNFEGGKSLS